MNSIREELLSIAHKAEQGPIPTLRVWSALGRASQQATEPFPLERLLIESLKLDLDDPNLNKIFFTTPSELRALRSRLVRVLEDLDGHLLAVNQKQIGELSLKLAQDQNLDRQTKSLERGLQRRIDEIKRIVSSIADFEDRMASAALIDSFSFLVRPDRAGKGAYERIRQAYEINLKRLSALILDCESIEKQLDLLEEKQKMVLYYRVCLARLKTETQELLDKNPSQGVLLSPTPPKKNPFVPTNGEPSGPPKIRMPKPKVEPVTEVKTEKQSLPELEVSRIVEAVRLGNEAGRLRLMIPSEGRSRRSYEDSWKELLTALGFTGKLIVAPSYESLPEDDVSPVLMPRTMHTHTHRWKKRFQAPLFVLDFPFPKLLMGLVKGSSGLN